MEKGRDFKIEKMVNYLSGMMGEDEILQFTAELNSDEELKREFNRLQKFWNQENAGNNHINDLKYWYRFKKAINRNEIRDENHQFIRMWLTAASIILLIAISTIIFVGYQPAKNLKSQMNYLVDTLPDGSLIYLSPNTTLKYKPNNRFGRKIEMTVVGQAFFVVDRQTNLNYIISAGDTRVTVTGTVFSIDALPNSQEVKVSVEAGEVILTNTSSDGALLVEAGEEAIFNSQSNKMVKQPKSSEIYVVYQPNRNH